MTKSVKTLALLTIITISALTSSAQLKLPLVNGVGPDIKKVLQDYPNQFNNLKGEILVQNPQSVDYACNFKVNGAEEATVTKYSSANKYEISSWQAVMLTTDDFEEAKKRFKSLYGQLNNLSAKIDGGLYLHLKAKYETPTEERKFTSVIFDVDNGTTTLKKLKVELTMQYELLEWKVKVLVYEKEREDHEKGDVDEIRTY
ncbi:MAG TPA: hypothetical protein VF476_02660 [Chitinophagaceae bacterium]